MFLSRTLGRTLFAAAARSKHYATTAPAGGREVRNPLQEFFEADRSPDDDKPVVYGMHHAPLVLKRIWCKNFTDFHARATIVHYNQNS